ncbi:MAG: ABC transporter substrate-binding protein [Streptosporangiaceae bacterium]
MTSAPKRFVVLTAAVLAAAGLAACSSSAKSSAPAATSSTAPQFGGTLHIVSASGPDHLDTVPAYYTVDYQLEHAYTRQLVQYPTVPAPTTASAGWTTDTTPAADVATVIPTAANGGITDNGTLYTFHIRPGVDWNTTPARQVTSQDFLREWKAFCNPVSPVGNPTYFYAAVVGMQAFCTAESAFFAIKSNAPTAANIANYQNTHSITGITTPNSMTIQFKLTSAISDFLYMMAMPFDSARPVEYDAYVPNSLQLDQHTISDGPYQISSYIPGKSITLVRNPAWKQSTDPLRHQYVSEVIDTLGVTSAQTQLSDMQAGTQDVIDSDTPINPASIPSLVASKVSNFQIWPNSDLFPYMVFNLRSPDSGGAAGKLLVRQAIEYGVDKVAAVKAIGGPSVAQVTNTVIPPGNVGYQDYNLYPDDSGQGNIAMCKTDLAKAGYPHGISLTYMYENDSSDTRIFTAIQASLAPCGITLVSKPEPGSSIFVDLGNSPENNKPGQWDIGQAIWFPDWFGNNGRTVIQALFQGPNCVVNTVNDGCYDNATVNSLITQAEGASSLSAAGGFWHQADMQIMSDAAIVPIMSQDTAVYSSARIRGISSSGKTYPTAIFAPNIGAPDITALWIAGG